MNIGYWLRNLPNLARGHNPLGGKLAPKARLYAVINRRNGKVEDLGLISTRVVTTAWVNAVVDHLVAGTPAISTYKYHGIGTGTSDEAAGDTALGTEVETRGTGSQEEGASANIYKTIGTGSITGTRAITEHGIFSAATVGTLLDRSKFSAINVVNGDSITFTYQLTLTAGS